jgi:hypothetical protein
MTRGRQIGELSASHLDFYQQYLDGRKLTENLISMVSCPWRCRRKSTLCSLSSGLTTRLKTTAKGSR